MTEYIISKEDFELLQEDPAHYDSALKFARIYDLKHEPLEEIIRCRDCAYSNKGSGKGLLCDYFEDANKVPALVIPNGFCSWAERDDQ